MTSSAEGRLRRLERRAEVVGSSSEERFARACAAVDAGSASLEQYRLLDE
jgi:hypothetical protein